MLTGSGRAFSARADKSLLSSPLDDPRTEQAGLEFSRLLDILGALDKPLLAAVNGVAVGFGATMLMCCDVVLVAQSARLRYPFTALGVAPEAGSSALVSMKARWPDAMWSMLSSEWIDANTAVDMGLAWRCVADDDLHATTMSAAHTIAVLDTSAVRATKRLMTSGRAAAAQQAIAREYAELRWVRSAVDGFLATHNNTAHVGTCTRHHHEEQ